MARIRWLPSSLRDFSRDIGMLRFCKDALDCITTRIDVGQPSQHADPAFSDRCRVDLHDAENDRSFGFGPRTSPPRPASNLSSVGFRFCRRFGCAHIMVIPSNCAAFALRAVGAASCSSWILSYGLTRKSLYRPSAGVCNRLRLS